MITVNDFLSNGFVAGYAFAKGVIDKTVNDTSVQLLCTGQEFNAKIKQLVNTSANYLTIDTSIYGIVKTEKEPSDNYIEIDTVEGIPIKAYLTTEQITTNDGAVLTDKYVVNLYTTASKIYLPSDSSYMFYGFKKIWSLDVSFLDASSAINCAYMFYCLGYNGRDDVDGGWAFSNLILGDSFNTSNVTNMDYMLYRIGCDWGDNPNIGYINLGALSTTNLTSYTNMFGHGAYWDYSWLSYIYANNQEALDLAQIFIDSNNLVIKSSLVLNS